MICEWPGNDGDASGASCVTVVGFGGFACCPMNVPPIEVVWCSSSIVCGDDFGGDNDCKSLFLGSILISKFIFYTCYYCSLIMNFGDT